MDGIDGLAGMEAATVAGVGGLIMLWQGEAGWASLAAVVALASAGFLALNWPPATIFMGDAGSGFLGFTLAALAMLTWIDTGMTLWPWLILLGIFIVDASLTLLRRALRRERVHEAHRSHAYQHAARHYGRHLPVTVAALLVNLFWLAPWAAAATIWPSWGLGFLLVAWTPLLLISLRFKAGLPE
jgi:Fuc2NAc and GlcNAc transferase